MVRIAKFDIPHCVLSSKKACIFRWSSCPRASLLLLEVASGYSFVVAPRSRPRCLTVIRKILKRQDTVSSYALNSISAGSMHGEESLPSTCQAIDPEPMGQSSIDGHNSAKSFGRMQLDWLTGVVSSFIRRC